MCDCIVEAVILSRATDRNANEGGHRLASRITATWLDRLASSDLGGHAAVVRIVDLAVYADIRATVTDTSRFWSRRRTVVRRLGVSVGLRAPLRSSRLSVTVVSDRRRLVP